MSVRRRIQSLLLILIGYSAMGFPKFATSGLLARRRLMTKPMVGPLRVLSTATSGEARTTMPFKELVSEKLCQALSAQAFTLATPIQSMSYSAVRSGNDVVIGAETGSGKTLAYLLPIIDEILSISTPPALDYPLGFILAPNKELCNQVESMAGELLSKLEEAGSQIKIRTETGLAHEWRCGPGAAPHFVICTPRYLSNFVRGPVIREEELFRNIHCLVLDEADMLLDGSYLKDVEIIMDALKVTRRGLIKEGVLQVHEKRTQFILSAATIPSFGLRSVQAFVTKRFPMATFVRTDNLHMHHPCIHQEFVKLDCGVGSGPVEGSRELILAVVRAIISDNSPPINSSTIEVGSAGESCSEERGGHGVSSNTSNTSNAGSSAGLITQSGLSLQDPARCVTALSSGELHAVNCLDHLVMVFLNTAEAAQRFAESMQDQGVQCVQFHSLMGGADRAESLRRFRQSDAHIMVCTDSAARGLDLPRVRHVVQADFALNVVQHQHRVGRASRAGRAGKATNFYWGARASALVESILGMTVARKKAMAEVEAAHRLQSSVLEAAGAVAELPGEDVETLAPDSSQSIDQSFSRRRGFRRNIKRLNKVNT